MQTTRRSRDELRATLVAEGRDILLTEGLHAGSSNLTFKRVFERVEATTVQTVGSKGYDGFALIRVSG